MASRDPGGDAGGTPVRLRSWKMLGLAAAAVFLFGACGGGQFDGGGDMAGMAPMLSVERFLQASNSQDLQAMGRLFGTADGPVAERGSTVGCAFRRIGSWIGLGQRCETREEVEVRLDAIARILRHSDYEIVSERTVPGRSHRTIRIGVTLVQGDRQVRDVPFLVVRTSSGGWLVQEIGLDRITGGGP